MDTNRRLTNGFTKADDEIIQELGLFPALVYGLVQRCEGMERHVCDLSYQTMANTIGASRSTVKRAMKELVMVGYVVDTTPDAERVPHAYKLGSHRPYPRVTQTPQLGSVRPPRRVLEENIEEKKPLDYAQFEEPLPPTKEPYNSEEWKAGKIKQEHAIRVSDQLTEAAIAKIDAQEAHYE